MKPASNRRRAVAAILVGLGVAAALLVVWSYGVMLRAPAAGTYHDDGIYLATAKSLAEGSGYRIISLPGEPPQTKYPPLLPLLLSVVWRIRPDFPGNLPWLRLVPLTAGLVWLFSSWILLRRLGSTRVEASAVVALVGVSPTVAFLATATMAETLFGATFAVAVLQFQRVWSEPSSVGPTMVAGGAVALTVLTRAAGVAPVAAGILLLCASGRWRTCAHYIAGVVVVAAPWFVWVAIQNADASVVDTYYSASPYASWNIVAGYAWSQKLVVLALNGLYTSLAAVQMWGVDARDPLTWPPAVVLLSFVVRGLWLCRREPVSGFMLIYLAMVMAWVWPPLRFLVPVLPILVWLGMAGLGGSGWAATVVALRLAVMDLCTSFRWHRTRLFVVERGPLRALSTTGAACSRSYHG